MMNTPLWLDILFTLIVSIIHIIYSVKFTKFSISFLKAKCDEKASNTQWSESKLYYQAILSHHSMDSSFVRTDKFFDEVVNIKLYDKLIVLRYILRILLFVCGCLVFTVCITISLNLLFEYFIICIKDYQHGSLFALIMFPFSVFIMQSIFRYMIHAISICLSMNTDIIAQNISYQQGHQDEVEYAETDALIINQSTPTPKVQNILDLSPNDLVESKTLKEQIADFSASLSTFSSQFFMGFHWRLWIVSLSILTSIIAFPTISISNDESVKPSVFFQLFIRYLFIAMSSWLFIYICVAILFSLYGRISTLFVFDDIINADTNKSKSKKRKNSFLRFFCLMDAFLIKDTNIIWKRFKIVLFTSFVISGVIFIIISVITSVGILWYIGLIEILYYAINVLLACKPRGMYFLWKTDMISLELQQHEQIEHSNQRNSAHFSDDNDDNEVTPVRSLHVTTGSQILTNSASITQRFGFSNFAQLLSIEDEEKLLMADNDNELKLSESPQNKHNNNNKENIKTVDEQLILMFISHYEEIYDRYRCLLGTTNSCAIHWNIYYYFKTIFDLYSQYWLLILPYNYHIRPLSVSLSGKSLCEMLIKYNYKKTTTKPFFQIIRLMIKHLWKIIQCPLITFIFLIIISILLYGSTKLHSHVYSNFIIPPLNETVSNYTHVHDHENVGAYPLCESLHWNGNLSTFDLIIAAYFPYFNVNSTEASDLVCLYFDGKNNTNSNCSWQIIHIRNEEPKFFHLRHKPNKTDLILIRGTQVLFEFIQDIALFNQIALMQIASGIIPITTILPEPFVIDIVYFTSLLDGQIENEIRARYDIPLFEYTVNMLANTKYKIDSLYFVGHSLGGALSQILSAKIFNLYHKTNYFDNEYLSNLEIKSLSLAGPGLFYSSKKFNLNIHDLYKTSIIIKPRYDVVSNVDKSSGFIQTIECKRGSHFKACHSIELMLHELVSSNCDVYDSNNPEIIKAIYNAVEKQGSMNENDWTFWIKNPTFQKQY